MSEITRPCLEPLQQKSKWLFFWTIWPQAVLFGYGASILAQVVFHAGSRSDILRLSLPALCVGALILAPLLETLFFQLIPIELTAALHFGPRVRLACSAIPFGLMHLTTGIASAASGLVCGFYLAYTYDRWRTESLSAATRMTCLLHSAYNLVAVSAVLYARW